MHRNNNITRTRHAGLFDLSETKTAIIGAGGIGSAVALALAKMGMDLTIFDGDIVEPENIATQLHPQVNLGMSKIVSMGTEIERHVKYRPRIEYGYVNPECEFDFDGEIVISGVDSIAARLDIWPVIKRWAPDWYIDMRMGAENLRIYSVYYSDFDWYDNLIEGQRSLEMPVVPCTEKATSYTGFMAAGWAGAIIRRIATGMPIPRLIDQNILEFSAGIMWPPGSTSNQ